MPRKISTLLNIESKELHSRGAFDGFIDVDSRLHVDPSLLSRSKIPEFKNAHTEFEQYFKEIGILISNSSRRGDKLWLEAHRRLQFREIGNTALGYSKGGTGGNAIGPKLAAKILDTVTQIFEAGVKDSVIFELVGMIEEGIGADRISDMTIAILIKTFAEYTQRVTKEIGAKSKPYKIRGDVYLLPYDPTNRKAIILVPKNLLNNLPIAQDWEDIDRVYRYNDELRQRINKIIGKSWKSIFKLSKKELKQVLLENPELLKDLIEQYKKKPKTAYDFANDPLGEIIWAELSEKAPASYPLNLSSFKPVTSENILQVVKLICEQYASLIENNGWFEYLYDNTGKLKVERAAQLLFYGISEVYCIANNLDINREINSGIGSLDFKVSRGFTAKVNVELKYSTNPNLMKGFEKQLPAYNRAEKTDTSIYLVIQTKSSRANIDAVVKLANKLKAEGKRVPEIIVVDGQKQISASKRK